MGYVPRTHGAGVVPDSASAVGEQVPPHSIPLNIVMWN
jgi:hypothetical protein